MDDLIKMQATLGLTKGERTRERILIAAENIFARVGFERATLREVAKSCGIQQPGIYNYFATKNDLYNSVLDRMLHPLVQMLSEIEDGPKAELNKTAIRVTEMLVENPNIAPLLMRAFLSTDQTEKDIALNWMERVMDSGPQRRQSRAGDLRKTNDALADMALFNVCLGYFWTAPMVERLTGRSITGADSLGAQKDLLELLSAALGAGD